MPAGPLIMAGGSVLSGILGGKGAKKAANAEIKMGQQALDLQNQMYQQNREDLAPWREAGGQAIGQGLAMLQPGYDYTASPGYQYRLNQGLNAVQNSAAAKGVLMSGGTLAGIDKEAQGLAAQDYNDQFNRVMAVAGGGQQAATSGAQLGANYANNAGDIMGQIGNARASGYVGQTNALTGMIGNLTQLFAGGGGGYGGGGGGYGYGGW